MFYQISSKNDDDESMLLKPNKEDKTKLTNKFHQIIEKDKEFILDCYRKQPLYKESIPQMEKASKGIFYYRRMVKNGLKNKSSFIKVILQSIAKVNQHKKIKFQKRKLKYGYKIPEIDYVRKRKLELEKRYRMKELEDEKKNLLRKNYSSIDISRGERNSLALAGINCIENYDSNRSSILNDNSGVNSSFKNRIFSGVTNNLENISTKNNSRINSSNRNRLFSGITNNMEDINIKNKSLTRSASSSNSIIFKNNIDDIINHKVDDNFSEKRIRKFNHLLSKCQSEINHGNMIGGKFEKFMNNINENFSLEKQRRNNKEDNNIQDQKIVEDKVTPKMKYKLMEIEKFKEMKKRIDCKISDNYVYFNRRKYSEFVKNRKKDEEYYLYLEDLNKINEKLEMKKVKEKQKLNQIETLLDDVYKKKNYLKNKIRNYSNNRKLEIEKEEYMKKNMVFNDDYFLLNEKKEEEHKGTLVPKLLSQKEEMEKNKKLLNDKKNNV